VEHNEVEFFLIKLETEMLNRLDEVLVVDEALIAEVDDVKKLVKEDLARIENSIREFEQLLGGRVEGGQGVADGLLELVFEEGARDDRFTLCEPKCEILVPLKFIQNPP